MHTHIFSEKVKNKLKTVRKRNYTSDAVRQINNIKRTEMSTNLETIKKTLIGITKGENFLDMLIEFERTLDNAEIFAYKNWILGELVEGPDISRYWFRVTWMYPYELMPDPNAGLRLTKLGAKVNFKKGKFSKPVRVRGPEDWASAETKKAKMEEKDVWLVTIEMPIKYITRGIDQMDQVISTDLQKANEELARAYDDAEADMPLPEPAAPDLPPGDDTEISDQPGGI